jgi:hypothetical protein
MGKEDLMMALAVIVLFIVMTYGMTLQMMTSLVS